MLLTHPEQGQISAGNITNITNPGLGPLADNGGPTLIHALLPGSPARDAGNPSFDTNGPDGLPNTSDDILFDQRGEGFDRITNGRLDIGAFEAADTFAPTADIVDVSPDPRNTNAGIVTINFNEDVTGVDIGDFTLTRDGNSVDISGLSLTQISSSQYTIDLSSVTADDGNYELALNAAGSGILDAVSNAFTDSAFESFAVDTSDPTVESVVINDGSAQRSRVTRLTVTFSEVVGGVDASSFVLTNTTTNTQVIPTVATEILNGKTVATLTFSGTGIVGGSLSDGDYTLTTLDTLADAAGNQLDGDRDGTAGGNAVDNFFRLFGDINGDRRVNIADFFQFRNSFNDPDNFNAAFDYNGDGVINIADFFQFRSGFGSSL